MITKFIKNVTILFKTKNGRKILLTKYMFYAIPNNCQKRQSIALYPTTLWITMSYHKAKQQFPMLTTVKSLKIPM